MKLTPKQDHFARLIALDGVNQAEAYRQAYDAGNMKPETIWQRASEVARHSKVAVGCRSYGTASRSRR